MFRMLRSPYRGTWREELPVGNIIAIWCALSPEQNEGTFFVTGIWLILWVCDYIWRIERTFILRIVFFFFYNLYALNNKVGFHADARFGLEGLMKTS